MTDIIELLIEEAVEAAVEPVTGHRCASTPQTRARHAVLMAKPDIWWTGPEQQFLYIKGGCGITAFDTTRWCLDF